MSACMFHINLVVQHAESKTATGSELTCQLCSVELKRYKYPSLNSQTQLRHVTSWHFDEPLFTCGACDERAFNMAAIWRHIKAAHPELWPPADNLRLLHGEFQAALQLVGYRCFKHFDATSGTVLVLGRPRMQYILQ